MTGYATPWPPTFMSVIYNQTLTNTSLTGGQTTFAQCLAVLMNVMIAAQNEPVKGMTISILINKHARIQLNALNSVYARTDS